MTTTAPARTVLRARSLSRVFGTGAGEVRALSDASLEVTAGELLVVRGPRGPARARRRC
jgi:putative ABC transport system ATP-binding protein